MQALADKVGTTASTISKLEKGPEHEGMKLTLQWMEKLAKGLDVEAADLLASSPRGEMDEDVTVYTPGDDDPLAPMARVPNHVIYRVRSDALQDLGIDIDDRIIVDVSSAAKKMLAPLCSVVLKYFEQNERKDKGKLLLRQFVPPDKFIPNSPEMSQPAVNRSAESIEVVGVVVMHPRDLRPAKPSPTKRRDGH